MTAPAHLLVWASVVATGIFAYSIPAFAHSPYFTQVEKIALPGGETGEIRLIHGDGILAVDPVRAVIVNAKGNVVARTNETVPMVIVCSAELRCRAIDLAKYLVLEPEPAAFRDGPSVYDTWSVMAGQESWGFVLRPATALETVEANFAFARRNKLDFFVPFALAALCAGALFKKVNLPKWSSRLRWLLWMAVASLRLLIALFLLALSLIWVWLSGITADQWLSVSAAGGGAMLIFMHFLRRARMVPSAA